MGVLTPLEPGDPQRLAGYLLAGRLGSGGQGVVYEGYDESGLRVAIKLLHGPSERVAKEVTAARRVSSFCTAKILAADPDSERPYIVTEYVAGPTLRSAVGESGAFEPDAVYRLATAIATALAAIHGAGVVHRDLKPDNVMLGPDGPRVIDFGIAHVEDYSLTESGALLGTPIYMAPEAFRGSRTSMAADIWAWGAVVLFTATGVHPFRADNIGAIMNKIISTVPDTSILPDPLSGLVAAALSQDARARPSAQEILLGLVGATTAPSQILTAGREIGARLAVEATHPSLDVLAENVFADLDPKDQELAPGVFLRLVSADTDLEDVLRRANADELLSAAEGRTELLEAYTAAGLLTRDGDGVRITHPALLRAWGRLREWIDAERAGLPIHRQLTVAMRRWEEHGRKDADLLQGSRLEGTLRWAATGRRHLTFTAIERAYLDAGTVLSRRQSRRRRAVTAALAVLLLLSVAGGGTAAWQWRAANAGRNHAAALAAAAQVGTVRITDPVAALLLSVAAWKTARTPETLSALYSAYGQREQFAFTDPEPRTARTRHLLSSDGTSFFRIGDGKITVWDVQRRVRIRSGTYTLTDDEYADLSPDGGYLVIASRKAVVLIDATTLAPIRTISMPSIDDSAIFHVDFTANDRYLQIDNAGSIQLLDLSTGRTVTGPQQTKHWLVAPNGTHALAFTSTGEVTPWDLALGQAAASSHLKIPSCRLGSADAVYSDDEKSVAVRCATGIEIFDASTGTNTSTFTAYGSDGLLSLSPDGGLLASLSETRLTLWNARTGFELMSYDTLSHKPTPRRPVFSGGSLRFVTEWDSVLSLDISRYTTQSRRPKPTTAQFSGDGRTLVAQSEDGSLQGWSVDGTALHTTDIAFTKSSGRPFDYSLNRNGRFLAITAGTHIDVWDLTAQRKVYSKRWKTKEDSLQVVLSPDGSLLQVTDASRSTLVRVTNKMSIPTTVEYIGVFSPDSRTLAALDGFLVDTRTGHSYGNSFAPVPTRDEEPDGVDSIAFSPDGSVFATHDTAGRVSFWRLSDQRRLSLATDAPKLQNKIVFSPNGRLVATATQDVTTQDSATRLWDPDTGKALGSVLTQGASHILATTFSTDSRYLLTFEEETGLHADPVDPALVITELCHRAGRSLSPAEWKQLIPEAPFQHICT